MLCALKGSYLACAITQHIFKTVNTCSHVEKFRNCKGLENPPGRRAPSFSPQLSNPARAPAVPLGAKHKSSEKSLRMVGRVGAGVHTRAIFIPRLPLPLSVLILSHKPCLPLPAPTPPSPCLSPGELGPRRDAIWPGLAALSTSEWHRGD